MTYFPDLTPYSYQSTDPREPWSQLPRLNVGWLDAIHPFGTGEHPGGLDSVLTQLAQARVQQTRGYHYCELCLHMLGDDAYDAIELNLVAHGSAEFRVLGHGVVYAVPELVIHYVTAHEYLPPADFCAAALAAA